MKETFQYIYGIHTCNAQLKLDTNSITKVFFKKPPYNNHLKTILKCVCIKCSQILIEKDEDMINFLKDKSTKFRFNYIKEKCKNQNYCANCGVPKNTILLSSLGLMIASNSLIASPNLYLIN